MSITGYYSSIKRLEEGKWYPFIFVKHAMLCDKSEYMILEDPYGIRHTIDFEPYKNYGLEVSGTIMCKVDKINCTGRLFLEPQHPCYEEGKTYLFNCNAVIETEEGPLILVSDCYNNPVNIPIANKNHQLKNESGKISAIVTAIHKGKLELSIE